MGDNEVPFHGEETYGYILEDSNRSIGEGAIFFDTVGTTEGDEISGSFYGRLGTVPTFAYPGK